MMTTMVGQGPNDLHSPNMDQQQVLSLTVKEFNPYE